MPRTSYDNISDAITDGKSLDDDGVVGEAPAATAADGVVERNRACSRSAGRVDVELVGTVHGSYRKRSAAGLKCRGRGCAR